MTAAALSLADSVAAGSARATWDDDGGSGTAILVH
jgi:hypothetical protein